MGKMMIELRREIEEISNQRQKLVDIQLASWDETMMDYAIINDKEIDKLAEEIFDKIKENRNNLLFEFIMEELTKMGHAPNLLYDDNGHWCLTSDGFQNVVTGEPDDVETTFFVPKNAWKNTVREALNSYLDDEEVEYENE